MDYRRSRFIATTLIPILSVVITAAPLMFQAMQFRKNTDAQARQSEDEKWREAMRIVSLADPKSSLVGAMAMQSFFHSDPERFGKQSQIVARR
jgi:hypothetical protein